MTRFYELLFYLTTAWTIFNPIACRRLLNNAATVYAKHRKREIFITHFILRECPGLFLTCSVEDVQDNSDLRWTVDQEEDLMMVRQLYNALGLGEQVLPFLDLVDFVRAHPRIAAINAGVKQRVV